MRALRSRQRHDKFKEGDIKELNIILRLTSRHGEVLKAEMLESFRSTDKVRIRVSATECRCNYPKRTASAGFGIERPSLSASLSGERIAASVAEKEKVDIRLHSISTTHRLNEEGDDGMLEGRSSRKSSRSGVSVSRRVQITKSEWVAGVVVVTSQRGPQQSSPGMRDICASPYRKIEIRRRFKDYVSEVKQGFVAANNR